MVLNYSIGLSQLQVTSSGSYASFCRSKAQCKSRCRFFACRQKRGEVGLLGTPDYLNCIGVGRNGETRSDFHRSQNLSYCRELQYCSIILRSIGHGPLGSFPCLELIGDTTNSLYILRKRMGLNFSNEKSSYYFQLQGGRWERSLLKLQGMRATESSVTWKGCYL